MKKLLFTLAALVLPLMASALTEKNYTLVNGIYYDFNSEMLTAAVSPKARLGADMVYSGDYSGSVEIPSEVDYNGVTYSVTSIGPDAFANCSLTSVIIPSTVTSIGSSAFYKCSSLESITIPNSLTDIAGGAFSGTAWLNNQPDGVVYINNLAYGYKGTMPENTALTLNEGTKKILGGAFYNCSNLASITIPNSVESIGGNVFYGCSSLTSVTIPNGVISIGNGVFSGCSSLTSVTIPDGVTSMGSAFSNCTGLKEIVIGNGVPTIVAGAFVNCSNLQSVTIGRLVTTIGEHAFQGCTALKTITLGQSVSNIEEEAFNGCTNLKDVYCYAETPPYAGMAFGSLEYVGLDQGDNGSGYHFVSYLSDIEATLHVLDSSIETYKNNNLWNNFFTLVTMTGEIQDIVTCATPTISFEKGYFVFSCDTEGVTFHHQISGGGNSNDENANKVKVYPSSITVSVYATKPGCHKSETATKTFTGLFGDLNNDGEVNVADHVELSNLIMGQTQRE